MKFQTTRKRIMETIPTVISVGYCDLQALLSYEAPAAYTAGKYGWNADLYEFGYNVPEFPMRAAIVTGYRPFGNVKPDHALVQRYEQAAKDFLLQNQHDAVNKYRLYKMITAFIKEACKK